MSRYIEFSATTDGSSVVIEVEDQAVGPIPVGVRPGEVARRAVADFESSMDAIRRIANAAVSRLEKLEVPPSEATVTFGLTFSADLGAVLAKASAEANLTVSVTWKPECRSDKPTT